MKKGKKTEEYNKAMIMLRELEMEYPNLNGISENDERIVAIRKHLDWKPKLSDLENAQEIAERECLTPKTCPRVIHITNKHYNTTNKQSYQLFRAITELKMDAGEALRFLRLDYKAKNLVYLWGYKAIYTIEFNGETLVSPGVRGFVDQIREKGYKISQKNVGKYNLKKHVYIADVTLQEEQQ